MSDIIKDKGKIDSLVPTADMAPKCAIRIVPSISWEILSQNGEGGEWVLVRKMNGLFSAVEEAEKITEGYDSTIEIGDTNLFTPISLAESEVFKR